MKRLFMMCSILVVGAIVPQRSDAQILDAINQAICDAIMAIDLGVQKVQTQTVYLQDAQKQVENIMSQTDLNNITSWVQQQKNLFAEYYQELWEIKTAISTYDKVKDIIQKQELIISEYKTAYSMLKQDPHFSSNELANIYSVYTGILNQSINNINQLGLVINAFVTQMSDGQRLKMIDAVGAKVDRNYSDLHSFTQQNIQLSMERAKDENDAAEIKALYGL